MSEAILLVPFLTPICLKQCCSNFPLLYSNLVSSLLNFIFNGTLLIYYKRLNSLNSLIPVFIIIILINLIISSILLLLFLIKSIKIKKQNMEYSNKFINKRKICSIIEGIIFFIMSCLSLVNLCFFIGEKEEEEKTPEKVYNGSEPNIIFFIFSLILCIIINNLWVTMVFTKINQKCCSKNRGCKKPLDNNITIPIDLTINNNFTQSGDIPISTNIKDNNEEENIKSKKEKCIKKEKKNDEIIKDIIFKTTSSIIITISTPLNVTLKELITFLLKKIDLNKSLIGKEINFLYNGGILDIKNKRKISDISNNKDEVVIMIIDINNKINIRFNSCKFIYKYDNFCKCININCCKIKKKH